ncbi:MAG: hypothetical protein EOP83_01460, partial [Verrucomicrobiaceae bacterium]
MKGGADADSFWFGTVHGVDTVDQLRADDTLVKMHLEAIPAVPVAVYSAIRSAQSAALPLAHIGRMT